MTPGISAQVLQEVRELRADIHKIDLKLEVHVAQDIKRGEDIDKLKKEVFNEHGLRERINVLENNVNLDDKIEARKDKFVLDIKTATISGAFVLIISILGQFLATKIF